jgi:hypothetical protein
MLVAEEQKSECLSNYSHFLKGPQNQYFSQQRFSSSNHGAVNVFQQNSSNYQSQMQLLNQESVEEYPIKSYFT